MSSVVSHRPIAVTLAVAWLAVAAARYTLQSLARPAGLGCFGFFTAFNGALHAMEFAVPGLPALVFALIGVVHLAFVFSVLTQPGAFDPMRAGGPDGTATSSNLYR